MAAQSSSQHGNNGTLTRGLTPGTIDLLLRVLDQVTLSAGDPAFEETALALIRARAELHALADDHQ